MPRLFVLDIKQEVAYQAQQSTAYHAKIEEEFGALKINSKLEGSHQFSLLWTSRQVVASLSLLSLQSMPPKKAPGPKYPCGTCAKSASTNALLCNFCDMWHHATVECIPWHNEETIKTLMDICKEQSCWSCKKCSNIMKKLNGRLATVEKDLKEVKHELGEVKSKQSDTDLEVANLRKDVAQVRKSTSENSAKMSAEVLTEMKDREDRKHNVIILGLKESPDSTNTTEIQAAENDLLGKLFSDMELPAETSENITFRTRLGKVEAGRSPRLFLDKF